MKTRRRPRPAAYQAAARLRRALVLLKEVETQWLAMSPIVRQLVAATTPGVLVQTRINRAAMELNDLLICFGGRS